MWLCRVLCAPLQALNIIGIISFRQFILRLVRIIIDHTWSQWHEYTGQVGALFEDIIVENALQEIVELYRLGIIARCQEYAGTVNWFHYSATNSTLKIGYFLVMNHNL